MKPAIYLRVSNADQISGYSLSQQEAACRAYCTAHGWDEPTVYVDEGRSAFTDKTEKRPRFAAMLDAAVAGEHDVIVVHKLDRFSRSLITTLRELQRLEAAKVGFVSIGESMDFTTPIGRVILSVLGAFAEFYSANLSNETKKGLAGRRAAGFRHSTLPYGARLVDGVGPAIEVDPDKAEHLATILRIAATNAIDAAALQLNDLGIPSRRGTRWWGMGLSNLLDAAGWLAEQPDPWPARYAAAVSRRHAPPVRADRRAHALTGLMRCTVCGGSASYSGGGTTRQAVGIGCWRGPDHPRGCLPGAPRKTYARHYEALVFAEVAKLPDAAIVRVASERLALRDDPALAELADLRGQLERLEIAWVRGRLTYDAHAALSGDLEARIAALAPRASDGLGAVLDVLAVRDALPSMEGPNQNAMLREIIERVELTGREVRVVWREPFAAVLAEAERMQRAA